MAKANRSGALIVVSYWMLLLACAFTWFTFSDLRLLSLYGGEAGLGVFIDSKLIATTTLAPLESLSILLVLSSGINAALASDSIFALTHWFFATLLWKSEHPSKRLAVSLAGLCSLHFLAALGVIWQFLDASFSSGTRHVATVCGAVSALFYGCAGAYFITQYVSDKRVAPLVPSNNQG